MKKMLVMVLAVACMGVGVACAEDVKDVGPNQKNECLLISKNCANETASIQEKIRRLQAEIQKGRRVYTQQELNRLNDKLHEVQTMLDEMLKGE